MSARSERPRPVESNAAQVADAPAPTPQAAGSQTAGSRPVQQKGQPTSRRSQSGQQQNQTVYNQPTGQNADGSGEEKAEHTKAVLSLVLGIVGVVIYWPSYFLLYVLSAPSGVTLRAGSIVGIVLGIVGLVLASTAKKAGNREVICRAGFVLSLIAIILNVAYFAAVTISVAVNMASSVASY